MEFLTKVNSKIKLMINRLFYFISNILWYFVFDVIYCYVCRPQEEQANQDGVVVAECATKYNHAQAAMVVGTKTVIGNIKAFMIQGADYKIRELQEAYTQNSAPHYMDIANSDDSDYDGDDECSEDDETENELGLNNGGECCGRRMITGDTFEEKFELVPTQTDITTAKPFKPKKIKPKKKKPKKIKPKKKRAKSKQSKLSRPVQAKRQKPMRNDAIEKQRSIDSSVTDHPMYAWDGGTVQYHPIKGPHCKHSTTATEDDQGSCTTSCVQCFDED